MFKKIFFLFILLAAGRMALAQDFPPKPNTLVTDYTNTLSDGDKQQLENKLVAFDDTSSTQIAVVLMKSVGDNDIEQYAVQLGRKWGIGQKGKNNGILLLAAMQDHKVTIQVGYGDEGALPDVTAKQIIDNDITPHFKQNDYYGGLDLATSDIIKYTKGEFKADKKAVNNNNSGGGIGNGAIILIVIVIFILSFIFRNRGGGGGQIISGRGSASPFWWFVAGDILGSSGRGGGDSWGGGSGGSSGGGGGFGGFGGGSFGGGGASGSW